MNEKLAEKIKGITPKNTFGADSFMAVLNDPEGKRMVEGIEWGSSDDDLLVQIAADLYEHTGFIYEFLDF